MGSSPTSGTKRSNGNFASKISVIKVSPLVGQKITEADQRRVLTPARALEAGTHLLVVGRPITEDLYPVYMAKMIHQDVIVTLKKLGSM